MHTIPYYSGGGFEGYKIMYEFCDYIVRIFVQKDSNWILFYLYRAHSIIKIDESRWNYVYIVNDLINHLYKIRLNNNKLPLKPMLTQVIPAYPILQSIR